MACWRPSPREHSAVFCTCCFTIDRWSICQHEYPSWSKTRGAPLLKSRKFQPIVCPLFFSSLEDAIAISQDLYRAHVRACEDQDYWQEITSNRSSPWTSWRAVSSLASRTLSSDDNSKKNRRVGERFQRLKAGSSFDVVPARRGREHPLFTEVKTLESLERNCADPPASTYSPLATSMLCSCSFALAVSDAAGSTRF